MKHVIAGQTDDGIIEWKLEIDGGGPLLYARKDEGPWFVVASVYGDEICVLRSGAEPLGLTAAAID